MSRVVLMGENSIGYINALIDIWNHGDCAVLLDWRIPFPVAAEMMLEADAHTCFIEKELFETVEKLIPDSVDPVVYEKQNSSAELLPSRIYEKFKENYSKCEAVVIYSSGTTEKSKGIILSHFAVNTNADAIIRYMNPTAGDCIYIAKALSHASTLTGELLVALKTGMNLVIAPTIVPPRYISGNVKRFHATIICLNPTLLSMLSDHCRQSKCALPSLKSIYVSGSILSDTVYEKARIGFPNVPIYNVYGLSEAGPRVTAQRGAYCRGTSVGKPIDGVEIKIVDGQGDPLPDGEYGIIQVKTPSMFNGYIIGERKHPILCGDWYNTGDVGYIDEHGELRIVGRTDDVIQIDAHKIYPSQIENLILKSGNVRECVVTAADIEGTDTLCCLYTSERDLRSDIKNVLGQFLMKHEIPKLFIRTGVIPRTPNGKISTKSVSDIISKHIRRTE